jgi:ribose transport system substrate-binding protein
MATLKTTDRLYLISVLSKALDILELLQEEHESMTLEGIHQHTRISKTTVYRVLKTFVHRGYLWQSQDGYYRYIKRPKKMQFGFAGQSAELLLSVDLSQSLRDAAASVGIDLLILDNQYDAAKALNNAEEFIRSKVDLVMEFQVEHEVGSMIADKFSAANIPLIAIDIPHPYATYFGVDNYRVGVEAGETLANYAIENWGGKVDWVLGLDLAEAAHLVQSRITGAFEKVRSKIPKLQAELFLQMNGRGMRDQSNKLIADFLGQHPKDKHILIAAATNPSALGAVDAVRELKRDNHVAIVGQDCISEAIAEMRKECTPLIASVSHERSLYGPNLINLALSLLRGQVVPPYNYVEHMLVTRKSLQLID